MKRNLSVLCLLLFAASALANGTAWFNGSFEEALQAASEDDKPIIIFYYADG